MDWKAHVESALDGRHPGLGHWVEVSLHVVIIYSTLALGIDHLPGDRSRLLTPGSTNASALYEAVELALPDEFDAEALACSLVASSPGLLRAKGFLRDPVRGLLAGQGHLAQVHDRAVRVALERGHHQVAVVCGGPERVGHTPQSRTCSI